jgi:hypothetical protein
MIQSMILVAASPLAKIFQRRWTVRENGKSYTMEIEQLVDDPDRVFKDEEFSILLPFSSGAEHFWHGIPKPVQDPLRREVICGGSDGLSYEETQWSGVVELRVDVDVLSMILGSAAGAGGGFDRTSVVTAIEDARRRANERCLKQARKTYSALKDQREKLKEAGNRASYSPSVSEFLCAHVLANEEKINQEKRDNMRRKVDDLIGQVEANATNKAIRD